MVVVSPGRSQLILRSNAEKYGHYVGPGSAQDLDAELLSPLWPINLQATNYTADGPCADGCGCQRDLDKLLMQHSFSSLFIGTIF